MSDNVRQEIRRALYESMRQKDSPLLDHPLDRHFKDVLREAPSKSWGILKIDHRQGTGEVVSIGDYEAVKNFVYKKLAGASHYSNIDARQIWRTRDGSYYTVALLHNKTKGDVVNLADLGIKFRNTPSLQEHISKDALKSVVLKAVRSNPKETK